jgi:hypothetical protein
LTATTSDGAGRVNRITPDMSERIWRVLVEDCGCRDDLRAKHSFMYYLATDIWSGHEWRFQGSLGFGGKFHNNCGRWLVGCYSEHRTPECEEMICRANERIAALKEEYNA